ncbi:hypothetical protein HK405_001708, partial [Cladochytrium tenue]
MPAPSGLPFPSPPPPASYPLVCRPPDEFPTNSETFDLLVATRNRLVASAAAASSALLRLPSRAFWAAVLNLSATPSDSPPRLPWLAFIDAYLRAHADAAAFTAPPLFADHGAGPTKLPTGESTAPTKHDILLSRRVCLLLRRLVIDSDAVEIRPDSSTGNAGWHARLDDSDAWTPIPEHPMTLVRLLDTLRVYSHTNHALTTELVKAAFSRFPTLGPDFDAAQQHVGERVHALLRHLAKRSKGKGKGKGAAVSESLQGTSEADLEAEFSEDIAAITFALLDLQTLALSDYAAAPVTSTMLENSFIASLLGCYDAVNQITAILPSPPSPMVSD